MNIVDIEYGSTAVNHPDRLILNLTTSSAFLSRVQGVCGHLEGLVPDTERLYANDGLIKHVSLNLELYSLPTDFPWPPSSAYVIFVPGDNNSFRQVHECVNDPSVFIRSVPFSLYKLTRFIWSTERGGKK